MRYLAQVLVFIQILWFSDYWKKIINQRLDQMVHSHINNHFVFCCN